MKLFLSIVLIFVIVDILIVAYVIYRRYRRRISAKAQNEIRKTWKEIIRESDYRHAVMEADKLLDHTLNLMGYKGNLGSKLKKNPRLFRDLNGLWAAHKVRNNIAHQMHYKIDKKVYKKTMLGFKQAFKDLKIF